MMFWVIILQKMGNNQTNFNTAYNVWIKYRSNLKNAQKNIDPLRNKPHETNTVNKISPTVNSTEKNKIVSKELYQKEINQRNIQSPKNGNTNNNTNAITPEQIRKKLPSVITGSNIAPLSHIARQADPKKDKNSDNNQKLKTAQQRINHNIGTNEKQPAETILIKNNNQSKSKQKTVKFTSKIDMIDSLKVQIKAIKQRIDTMANSQEKQYLWILSQLDYEKAHGLTNKNKVLFLIKQSKQYQKLIVGLRTKRQQIVRVLNDLNQLKVNPSVSTIINETNYYIDKVQQQFIRIDWRAIITQASTNLQRYIDVLNIASNDQYCLQKMAKLQKKIQIQKQTPHLKNQGLHQDQKKQLKTQPSFDRPQSPLINNGAIQDHLKNQKLPPKDNRKSHQIMIDTIEKMIAGGGQKQSSNQVQRKQRQQHNFKKLVTNQKQKIANSAGGAIKSSPQLQIMPLPKSQGNGDMKVNKLAPELGHKQMEFESNGKKYKLAPSNNLYIKNQQVTH